MYSKDELMEKDAAELAAIANDMEAHINANATKEENVYAILDKQAEVEGNKNPLTTTKRKRTRITKKDTDIVYSVNGKDGENFDLKKASLRLWQLQKQQLPRPLPLPLPLTLSTPRRQSLPQLPRSAPQDALKPQRQRKHRQQPQHPATHRQKQPQHPRSAPHDARRPLWRKLKLTQ